jgi:hypothetical protein
MNKDDEIDETPFYIDIMNKLNIPLTPSENTDIKNLYKVQFLAIVVNEIHQVHYHLKPSEVAEILMLLAEVTMKMSNEKSN